MAVTCRHQHGLAAIFIQTSAGENQAIHLASSKVPSFSSVMILQVYSFLLDFFTQSLTALTLEGMNVSAVVVKITESARNFVISLIVKLSIEIE